MPEVSFFVVVVAISVRPRGLAGKIVSCARVGVGCEHRVNLRLCVRRQIVLRDQRHHLVAVVAPGERRAQSPYSYSWCSLGGKRGSNALSCYYTSWEQCRTTMSGIGGNCVQSPYYHPQPT